MSSYKIINYCAVYSKTNAIYWRQKKITLPWKFYEQKRQTKEVSNDKFIGLVMYKNDTSKWNFM